MGTFELKRAVCTGITVDKVGAVDLSDGLDLELGIAVSGLGISCSVHGLSIFEDDPDMNGEAFINISLANTSLAGSVAVAPYFGYTQPDLPVPMGQLNSTGCEVDLKVASMTWAGHGELIETLNMVGEEMILEYVALQAGSAVCEGLKEYLEGDLSKMLEESQMYVDILLGPLPPLSKATAKTDIVNWNTYPPLKVAKTLLRERWPLFAGRAVEFLNVAELDTQIVSYQDLAFKLIGMNVHGVVEGLSDDIAILTGNHTVGLSASLDGLRFTTSFGFETEQMRTTMNVTVGPGDLLMNVRAMVDEEKLNNLEIDDAMASPGCAAELIEDSADPRNAAFEVDTLHFTLVPPTDLAPLELAAEAPLASELSQVVNTIFQALLGGYHPSVMALMNGALGASRGILSGKVWESVDTLAPCDHRGELEVLTTSEITGLYWITLAVGVMGLPIGALVQCISGRRPDAPAQARAEEHEVDVKPLCLQGFVPKTVAVYYLFAVVGSMLLFICADLDVGATVTMVMAADDDQVALGPLFSFSLIATIAHCWTSGAYFIAVLTVIASGVWPFTKLAMLIVTWVCPPRYLSVSKRGSILAFLDSWGKYSFLDSWFLVVTLSAFAINWEGLRGGSLQIQTTPKPAFYAFLAATVLSLVLGHVGSEFHQHALEKRESSQHPVVPQPDANQDASAGAAQHQDKGSENIALCSFATTQNERACIIALIVLTIFTCLLGIFTTSFSFEASGVLTEFLFGENIEKSYSIFSVGAATAEGRYGEFGLLCLEAIFVTLAVFVPFLLLGSLLTVWMAPMTQLRQKNLLRACYMLDAWASLDVAVLVLAIACHEFARLAKFLVYEGNFAAPCNMIKDITKEECLDIKLHAHLPMIFVFMSGILLVVAPKVAMNKSHRCLEARTAQQSMAKGQQEKTNNAAVCESNPDMNDGNPENADMADINPVDADKKDVEAPASDAMLDNSTHVETGVTREM